MFKVFAFVLLICAVALSGCSDTSSKPSKNFHFKVQVKANYGGRPVEGEAVLMQPYLNSPQAFTRGEAAVIELGGNKRAYLLLVERGGFSRLYVTAISNTFLPKFERGQRPKDYDVFESLANVPLNQSKEYKYLETHFAKVLKNNKRGFPLVVAFKNENDPSSVFLVETERRTQLFGKPFNFQGIFLERVPPETPLTNEIVKYLPWVDQSHQYWETMRAKGFSGEFLGGLSAKQSGKTKLKFSQQLQRKNFASSDRRY